MKFPDDAAIQNVGQIASHNTYKEESHWINAFYHVNSVELDVWPRWNWLVAHDEGRVGGHLVDYMKDLKRWRTNNSKHHPLITIFIEIKSSAGWRVPDFESILRSFSPNWESDIFSPMDLVNYWKDKRKQNLGINLRSLVRMYGWPVFPDLRNKVMFILNGDAVIGTYLKERPLRKKGPLRKGSTWSTDKDTLPVAFVMAKPTDQPKGFTNIVIWNDTYNSLLSSPTQGNILRRAYEAPANEKLSGKNKNLDDIKKLMRDNHINYMAYDNVKNGFSFTF